jgi:gamma-glutamyltranspeptidase
MDDLRSYKPIVRAPIEIPLDDRYKLFTLPPPSSGLLVGFIMNIMSSKKSLNSVFTLLKISF